MAIDPNSPILVTGATGRHGNTGEHLVGRLIAAGRSVRVLARSSGSRTQRLADLGAEVVVGDLADRRTLVPALQGVDLAYFVYPIDDGIVTAAANYAAAVREVGRRPRTVVMSMGPAHPEHPSALGRGQWLAEQVLGWAGLDLTVLRVAALFHENVAVLQAASVRDEDVMRNCFGTGHPSIADVLTEVLGRPIGFEPVTKSQWREELVDLAGATGGGPVNVAMAQHISSVADQIAQGGGPAMNPDPDRVRRLIGREPARLADFLAANADSFRR